MKKFIIPPVLFLVLAFSSSFDARPYYAVNIAKGWAEIGKQSVSPGAEYDRLIVETEEKYKQLKFKVLKAPIYIRNITIIYHDDTSENHIITRRFKKGNSSRVFDLAGHERTIKQVIFVYNSRISGKGLAELVVMAKN